MNVNEAIRCVDGGQRSSRDGYAVLFNLEIVTTLKDEVERLRAELAAAKAASVVPVQVVYCDPDYERTATVRLWSNADAQRFADWLRERMKDKTPPEA